jgi:hypothetical protein
MCEELLVVRAFDVVRSQKAKVSSGFPKCLEHVEDEVKGTDSAILVRGRWWGIEASLG